MTYVIIDTDKVVDIDFSEVKETSADTLRYSLNGTKTFVKFEGDTPSFLEGEDTLNHAEILEVLSGEAWTETDIDNL